VASEAVPYSKTGGLADVAGALPKALRQVGVDSLLITPFYQQTKHDLVWHTAVDEFRVEWRGRNHSVRAFYSEENGSPTFLIHSPEFFFRSSIYGFNEDYDRFAFFNRSALALLKIIGRAPDIIHLNDWHCGFAAAEIAHLRYWDPYWRNAKTVLSIHNMAYQGVFDAGELPEMGFHSHFEQNAFLFNGAACALKAGLSTADTLSTVSRRYSFEIQTPENGFGLDWLVRDRTHRMFGITNGVDYDVWNPETDPELDRHYSAADLDGKQECKRRLLNKFSLPEAMDKPLFASVTRLTAQKGFRLIQETIGEIIENGGYFVSLGSGESEYEDFLQRLRDAAPKQVGIFRGYNEPLAHQIEAGADIFLMPSKFEPCGLNQMYSLRYGTVPIVHAVGGLDDTVEDFNRLTGQGNGFKFQRFAADDFLGKIFEAFYAFAEPDTWRKIQLNGMKADNSWTRAALNYVDLYRLTSALPQAAL
jgi:starch synthase